MSDAAVERILSRLCDARGGSATREGDGWRVEVPDEYSFHQRVAGIELSCDAPLDTYSVEQARAVAVFERELAEALLREKIRFPTLAELATYLATHREVRNRSDEGFIEVPNESEWTLVITTAHFFHEPWIELALAFHDDTSPDWMLERNGELVGLAFEIAPSGGAGLRWSMPLALVTAQRLLEMIEDLELRHRAMLAMYEERDEDEAGADEEAEADVEPWPGDSTAIVGPWPDKDACMRALDAELREMGCTKVTTKTAESTVALVYRIGNTMWISGDAYLAARLAYELDDAEMYGVEVSDEDASSLTLWALGLDADGDLYKDEVLGADTGDRLDAETQLAARSAGVAASKFPSQRVYYVEAS